MFGIEVEGLEGLQAFLGGIQVSLKKAETELPKEFAKRVFHKLKDNAYNQRLKLLPLSPKYIQWKRRQGLSTRILISTGEYVRSIQLKKVGNVWRVLVPPDLIHSGSDISMEELARVLEFGSVKRNISPRPLWALTHAQAVREYPKFAKEFARKLLSSMAGFNVGKGRGGRNLLTVTLEGESV